MKRTVAVPTSVAAGAATTCSAQPGESFTVYLNAVGTATYQGQISPDGVEWFNEGAALTATGDLQISKPAAFFRWNCTAYTSGTPDSHLFGQFVD